MVEEKSETEKGGSEAPFRRGQKLLLSLLYLLMAVMIVFSLLAAGNLGQEGYDRCIQKKCDGKGQEFCSKAREVSNCCQGAGGEMVVTAQGYSCAFS